MNLYVVVIDHPSAPYVPERDFAHMDRATTVRDILNGDLSGVIKVLEVGTGKDVTKEIATDVRDALDDEGEGCPSYLVDWLDHHVAVNTADGINAQAGLLPNANPRFMEFL